MIKVRSATRMALSIGIGCASLIWIATAIGLVPDPIVEQGESRINATKTIAVNVATFAENRREVNLKKILERTLASNPCLESVAVKRDGAIRYAMAFGDHEDKWNSEQKNDAGKQIGVSILANGRPWGELQIVFTPYESQSSIFGLAFPFGLIIFVFAAVTLFSWIVLSRSLKYLNPSNVVPSRVRSALDTLAEGLVLLDGSGEIAHANEAFQSIVSFSDKAILGRNLNEFGWDQLGNESGVGMPWEHCLIDQQRVSRQVVNLTLPDETTKTFAVNATPIFNGESTVRGVLVSFDDVTVLESKNAELAKIIGSLRNSRDEVARQNERLAFLASYDPLTKCMNRRSFFAEFEKYWADEDCKLLNLLILDIDNFKSINDTHGHSTGDEILVLMGHLLRESIGDRGIVCRYGGEEFVVLIPGITIDQCESFANDLRILIEQTQSNGINFTASIGVSCREFIPMDAQHLLDQADECLYVAKRSGRNRVVRFDKRSEYEETKKEKAAVEALPAKEIEYSAVTGLLSALSFRCPRTAAHSIRVADLCVILGEKLMSRRELFQLEVAALMHDIGKIGVPDAILFKAGPLTPEEWVQMRKHDKIGAEIVRSALSAENVARYIETHHQRNFDESENSTDTIIATPLASQIISVCDAYDALTNDRAYRAAISPEEAVLKLERDTPGKFDAKVVAILAEQVREGHHQPGPAVARPIFSQRQATAIGQHIQDLYEAVDEEDVQKLQEVVRRLRDDSSGDTKVTDVADRLDEAIGVAPNDDLEQVLKLATEVMQICRESRTTFVDSAESIVGSDQTKSTSTELLDVE